MKEATQAFHEVCMMKHNVTEEEVAELNAHKFGDERNIKVFFKTNSFNETNKTKWNLLFESVLYMVYVGKHAFCTKR